MDEATHKLNFKPIILRDLFMEKNPRAGRLIPGFVYRYLSRMLRIDFMNDPILYNLANHRTKHFVITFGKPIPYQTFDKRFTPLQWAARVKDYTYSLVAYPDGEFGDLNN